MRQSALRFATQHAKLPEFGRKWLTEVSQWERSVLALGSQVRFVYLAKCGIQRHILKKNCRQASKF